MSDDLETLRCINCRYELRGLTEHRCPECGTAFDPNDPLTTHHIAHDALLPFLAFVTTYVVVHIALVQAYRAHRHAPFYIGDSNGLIVTACIALSVGRVVRALVRRAMLRGIPDPHARRERKDKWITLWLALGMLFVGGGTILTWTCPHGTTFTVGILRITQSDKGGPCANHGRVAKRFHVARQWYVWFADV